MDVRDSHRRMILAPTPRERERWNALRLLKANDAKRAAFVAEYAALLEETSAVRGQDILCRRGPFPGGRRVAGQVDTQGRVGVVNSASPRRGEKASYYSAVCLETGEVEWMGLEGNSNAGTSVAFLRHLRERRPGRLNVIWGLAPAHRGEAVRQYLRRPGLELRLVNPRFHEGRLCRATARTSTPVSLSGAGLERNRPETCAWAPRPWCGRRSATSWPGWPTAKMR